MSRERLIRTKLDVPPPPTALVARPRLLDRLSAAVAAAPVTLVAAPAGAGKTVLVSAWTATRRTRGTVAWLTLDAQDSDRGSFWSAVLTALAPACGRPAAGLGIQPDASVDALLPSLVEALERLPHEIVLVLDDIQELTADETLADLDRLLQVAPPRLRIVLISRTDPPIALPRLRVRGQLSEVRADDLAFTLPETLELFQSLGIDLTDEAAAHLWQRTEGWVAGLYLAALELRGHPDPARLVAEFSGDDATVSDYLLAEVLAHQPPYLREFLLRTSVVDALDGDLADTLTGRTDGAQMLAALARRSQLVIPLDTRKSWYRTHLLLRDVLRSQLPHELPDEAPRLHRRAAGWLAERGDAVGAVQRAVAAEDWDLVARLVADSWLTLLVHGEARGLDVLVERVPRERIERDPELALAIAGAALDAGDPRPADALLPMASAASSAVAPERQPRVRAAMAAVSLLRARVEGDVHGTLTAANELLRPNGAGTTDDAAPVELRAFALANVGIAELWAGELDAASRHLASGLAAATEADRDYLVLLCRAHLAVAEASAGRLPRSARLAQDALELARRRGWERTAAAGAAYAALAGAHLHWNDLDAAEGDLHAAGAALRRHRDPSLRAMAVLDQVRLLAARGDYDSALAALQWGREELGGATGLGSWSGPAVAQEALLYAALGERDRGRRLLDLADVPGAPAEVPVARAKLLLADSEPEAALATLATAREGAAPAGQSTRIETHVLTALAHAALADRGPEAEAIEQALELAEPMGYRSPFLQGRSLAPVLRRRLRLGTAHRSFAGELLETVEGGGARRPDVAILLHPLSVRETAVLRYLPTAMSNREIAAELFVSVNTVKTHLKRIYNKLEVLHRRDAVRRARELGLLGPAGRDPVQRRRHPSERQPVHHVG